MFACKFLKIDLDDQHVHCATHLQAGRTNTESCALSFRTLILSQVWAADTRSSSIISRGGKVGFGDNQSSMRPRDFDERSLNELCKG
ncbi:hypothetical protein RB213_003318, partial [Colletotrichum asianum]